MTKIRGMTLTAMLDYIRDNGGDKGIRKVFKTLDKHSRKILSEEIKVKEWYPYDVFIKLNIAIDKVFGKGDLKSCITVGEYVADKNLSSFLKLFMLFSTPHQILRKTKFMWRKYVDSGKAVRVSEDKKSAVYRLVDFDTHRVQCYIIQGWIGFAVKKAGGKNFRVEETRCITKGDRYCEFVFKWD